MFKPSILSLLDGFSYVVKMNSPRITAGIHLPQAGPAASADAIAKVAELAESLGFGDVWVSDHLIIPADAKYPPSAYIYEPLAVMAWVAAKTSRVKIGTTVLVLPMRNPIVVAKSLASIDLLSGGRVILGTAAGWLKAEFDALGIPFNERGKRTDEALEMIQRLWEDDKINASYPIHQSNLVNMRAKPQPNGPIPIWIGGHADVALQRASRVGDGWHGAFLSAAKTEELIQKLLSLELRDNFVFSMRTSWDPLEDDESQIASEIIEYMRVGVTHFVPEPRQRNIKDYMDSVRILRDILEDCGVSFS